MGSSRRDFFKQALGIVGAAVSAPTLLRSLLPSVAYAQGGFVVPGQGMAASVGYQENRSKVDKKDQIARAGVKFADQKCSNCTLFTKEGAGPHGKCALFPGQQVKADAFCRSWAKKA